MMTNLGHLNHLEQRKLLYGGGIKGMESLMNTGLGESTQGSIGDAKWG